MEIFIPNIPVEGQKIEIDPQVSWVKDLITERLESFLSKPILLSGKVQIFRVDKNVSLSGKLHLEFHPTCDRCAQDFVASFSLPLRRHMTPFFEGVEDKSSKKEVELQEEDLEFSTYFGDEFDLSDVIVEEINLGLPLNYNCREDCAGLCSKCGKNLNEGPCQCSSVDEMSPFNVLKDIKFPKK